MGSIHWRQSHYCYNIWLYICSLKKNGLMTLQKFLDCFKQQLFCSWYSSSFFLFFWGDICDWIYSGYKQCILPSIEFLQWWKELLYISCILKNWLIEDTDFPYYFFVTSIMCYLTCWPLELLLCYYYTIYWY